MKDGEGSKDPVTPEKQKASQEKDKLSMVEWEQQTNARNRIREEMRKEMLKCPVPAFLADYSPFLPDDALVEAAKAALAERQLLVVDEDDQLTWRDFDEAPCRNPSEMRAFKPLEAIAAVFDNNLGGLDGRQQHFFYRDCPYANVKSEIGGCNFKLDACFTGDPGHANNSYIVSSEAAVVTEFKKFTKDFESNREQLVSAASHIMNDDPCRKWMYGITIENTEMAIWYFSRSHSVKSAAFNFTADPEILIRVFLSFTYATREEMGYDLTVHRIEDNGIRYVYEIPTESGTRYFKTIDLLSHHRVLCITGRKTRVWSAVEVNGYAGSAVNEEKNGGRKFALKDVWLDKESKTEGQKLEAIFQSLSTIKDEAYQWAPEYLHPQLKAAFDGEGYKRYFMGIVCDSFSLGESKGISAHATPAPGILEFSGKDPVDDDGGGKPVVKDRHMLPGSTQTTGSTRSAGNKGSCTSDFAAGLEVKPRLYKVKKQYRLVYEEVGLSLDRVTTLETAFTAVLDAYIALVLMYLAGWMHRDVSAGNILAVKRTNGESGGKLSDLEYAKHYKDESGSADPKTGTAFFMPLEIHMARRFKRPPTRAQAHLANVNPFTVRLPGNNNLFSLTQPELQPSRPKHRFQYDLESLWWVALYLLIYRAAHSGGKLLSDKIFISAPLPSLARQDLFLDEGAVVKELQKSLHPALQDETIRGCMGSISNILYTSYFVDEPARPEVLDKVYHDVFLSLALLVVTVRMNGENVTLRAAPDVHPMKREREETSSKPLLPRQPRDGDEYKTEEEEEEEDEGSGSDDAMPKRRKTASTGRRARR